MSIVPKPKNTVDISLHQCKHTACTFLLLMIHPVKMKYICEICKYKTDRSDNFSRHRDKHSKKRIQCGCGKNITRGAFWRHKLSCTKTGQTKQSDQKQKIPNGIDQSFERIVKLQCNVRVHEKNGKIWIP